MTGADDRLRLRITLVGLVVMTMFSMLVTRLWFLQVLAGEQFAEQAKQNYVRIVSREAARGRIVDRQGRIIVKNRTALAVGIRKRDLPGDKAQARTVLVRLSRLLDMDVREINERLSDPRNSPYTPALIKKDVRPEVIFSIRERQAEFPGVETMTLSLRTYPYGSIAAHVIGYVGEINDRELKRLRSRYRLGDAIGRTGLERMYEDQLRGQPGLEKLIVDATGRVLRTLGGRPPEPGSDVQVSIDVNVQKVAEEALEQGIERARQRRFYGGDRFRAPAGAAVVMDIRTGEIVALASHPTFDLRKFVGGVHPKYFASLNDPDNHNPLYNRAVQSAYPPGSTFKPIVAAAALEAELASPSGRYPCRTAWRFGDSVFRNWQPRNEDITLAQSLVESCDTVYYHFARQWWLREHRTVLDGGRPRQVMQDWAKRFGLGQPTGIDLPSEEEGFVPGRTERERYCKNRKLSYQLLWKDVCELRDKWRGGDAVITSIGQGEVLATPLQMAVVYAAIANGGKLVKPHIAQKVIAPDGSVVRKIRPVVRRALRLDASALRYIQTALRDVPERGTGQFPYREWPLDAIPMAAKTGSAEIQGKQPYSWFASYGPADNPRYVTVAAVEEAGSGSQAAGPVVRRIMDELFDRPPLPIVYGTRSD